MNRIALQIGSLSIYWYSIMIILGIIAGSFAAYPMLKKKKIDIDNFFNMVFYAILFGLLGARIWYVLFNLDYYLENPSEIIAIWNGGLAIQGGLIFGVVVIYLYSKKHNMKLLENLDIMAVSVQIGQAFGRWGNFFNGEAHGGIVTKSFIEHFPKFIQKGMFIEGNYYHPTFLYESGLNLLCFIFLLFYRRKEHKDGTILSIYLIFYGIIRFFIEGLRTDSLMLGNIRVAQLISILFIIIGIIILVIINRKKEENKEETKKIKKEKVKKEKQSKNKKQK